MTTPITDFHRLANYHAWRTNESNYQYNYSHFLFGVSFKTVAGWENSHDTMPLTKLVKFCNLYKFSIDYVIGLSKVNNYVELDKLDRVKIGNKLKRIRQKLGLTQETIASECMISQATYSGYENGKYLITSLCLYTICYNHKISMNDILKK